MGLEKHSYYFDLSKYHVHDKRPSIIFNEFLIDFRLILNDQFLVNFQLTFYGVFINF